jgi:transposase-like protein
MYYASPKNKKKTNLTMPCYTEILCPHCKSKEVAKAGFSEQGKQRYRCKNTNCPATTFLQHYTYNGYLPEIKKQIIDMSLNGSGIRDTARVLKVSQVLVMQEIKKKPQ